MPKLRALEREGGTISMKVADAAAAPLEKLKKLKYAARRL